MRAPQIGPPPSLVAHFRGFKGRKSPTPPKESGTKQCVSPVNRGFSHHTLRFFGGRGLGGDGGRAGEVPASDS